MYRLQSQQLATARVGTLADDPATLRDQINSVLDLWQNVITACGPLEHDTDGGQITLRGNSPINAGRGSGLVPNDWATLSVVQENPFAGSTHNPNLYALNVTGPTKLNGAVHIPATAPIYGIARLATATANWVDGAVPTVAATDNDTGAALVIKLYRTCPDLDPNVRTGSIVVYALDLAGNAVATGNYLSVGLGSILFISGSIASIAANYPGWQLCDGTNGTPNLLDQFIVCASADAGGVAKTNITGALTVSGGATSHNHTGLTGNASPGTDTQGAHTHTGNTGAASPGTDTQGMHSHGAATGYAITGITVGGYTDYATTGISWPVTTSSTTAGGTISNTDVGVNTSSIFTGGGAVTAVISLTTPNHNHGFSGTSHNHTISDPEPGSGATKGHRHALGSSVTITEPNAGSGHQHSISNDGSHSHTVNSHTHTISSDGGHSHTVNAHNHSISSDTHLPPYYALAVIMRVN